MNHTPYQIRRGNVVTIPTYRSNTTIHARRVTEYDGVVTITDTTGYDWHLNSGDRVHIHN